MWNSTVVFQIRTFQEKKMLGWGWWLKGWEGVGWEGEKGRDVATEGDLIVTNAR